MMARIFPYQSSIFLPFVYLIGLKFDNEIAARF